MSPSMALPPTISSDRPARNRPSLEGGGGDPAAFFVSRQLSPAPIFERFFRTSRRCTPEGRSTSGRKESWCGAPEFAGPSVERGVTPRVRKKVRVAFDEPEVTGDAGLLLLMQLPSVRTFFPSLKRVVGAWIILFPAACSAAPGSAGTPSSLPFLPCLSRARFNAAQAPAGSPLRHVRSGSGACPGAEPSSSESRAAGMAARTREARRMGRNRRGSVFMGSGRPGNKTDGRLDQIRRPMSSLIWP